MLPVCQSYVTLVRQVNGREGAWTLHHSPKDFTPSTPNRFRQSRPPITAVQGTRTLQLKSPPSTLSPLTLWCSRKRLRAPTAVMWMQEGAAWDVFSSVFTSGVAFSLLRFWEELAERGVFDQVLSRKLVHISVGLVFIFFWPMFSLARFMAAVPVAANVARMLLLGLGIWRNDGVVKSMTRYGDRRELLRGPLFYACTISLATLIFWRTSPIGVAAVCSLCAGDGFADIIGRRFGSVKLPYNPSKSYAGSLAMAVAGFTASIGYMFYFSAFGFMEATWGKALGFLVVSLAATAVESLPISTELDDNLTVPLTSFIVGSLIF